MAKKKPVISVKRVFDPKTMRMVEALGATGEIREIKVDVPDQSGDAKADAGDEKPAKKSKRLRSRIGKRKKK